MQKITIHDCTSGKVIERDMTPEEEAKHAKYCTEQDAIREANAARPRAPTTDERLAALEDKIAVLETGSKP